MEEYIVSARKYRPARFEDVIGQEHITSTLYNAIRTNHLAHSFLFCGPRGVGKTTCARILAKLINSDESQPDLKEQDYSFNVFELDAASNNSVDDIRNLTEQVRIPPQIGRYKVYIIDEVHMLSTAAFNAFLKTLEEPPPYAIFILATTEKNKILPTILSRCQVFDFRRISVSEIVVQLKKICVEEHISAEEKALHVIARKADGAMRDALSMFDRLLSVAGKELKYEHTLEHLNVLDDEYFFRMADAFIQEDASTVMQTIDELQRRGFDGDDIMLGLSSHLRNLLVSRNAAMHPLLEVSSEVREHFLQQAEYFPASLLLTALSILSEADQQFKASKNKRLLLEVSLLRICYLPSRIQAHLTAPAEGELKKKMTV